MIVERYSFVVLTPTDLTRARRFWVEQLGFSVTEEEEGRFFIIDAGTPRLCLDLADGDVHRSRKHRSVIAFKVASVAETLADLATHDVYAHRGPVAGHRGTYAELRDPDGRVVVLTEED